MVWTDCRSGLSTMTAQIDIVAEVAGSDRLASVGLNLLLVRFVNDAIAIGIGRQETKRNVAMWLAVAVDVLHTQRDDFRTRHASQLRGHAVTTEGDRTNRGGTADNRNLARGDRPHRR